MTWELSSYGFQDEGQLFTKHGFTITLQTEGFTITLRTESISMTAIYDYYEDT